MVDGVDEADPDVRVVVGHQHDVEQLLTLRVQLAQSGVDGLQSLGGTKREWWSKCDVQPGALNGKEMNSRSRVRP